MKTDNKRVPLWDNLKGVLIFLVVFAHCIYGIADNAVLSALVKIIYLFHMPAFVFISGRLGRSERSQSAPALLKLAFSFLIFNGFAGIIAGQGDILVPLYSYWYLLALIVWRLTAKYVSKIRFSFIAVTVIALAAGFASTLDNTLASARIVSFYPFYLAGYMLDSERISSVTGGSRSRRAFTGGVCLALSAAFGYLALSVLNVSLNALLMFPYENGDGFIARVMIFLCAAFAVTALICLIPRRRLPVLTMLGRNSFSIFVLHRIFTLLICEYLAPLGTGITVLIAFFAALLLCVLLGNDMLSGALSKYLELAISSLNKSAGSALPKARLALVRVSAALLCCIVVIASVSGASFNLFAQKESVKGNPDVIFQTITDEQQAAFDGAFKIVFSGDLILLEEQVQRGYKNGSYNFDDVFEYAKPYISSADLAIGVFEGPMPGKEAGYSVGNFDDGKELRLGFPDEFALAVKNAGFDLVTNANNHLFDRGISGAKRTLDVLDGTGLDHTGSYRSADEKKNNRVKIIEKDGIKFAVLSYTYGSNYMSTEELANGEYSYSSSFISGTGGKLFEQLKAQVEADFKEAKALNPDLIIVLPHIGTQFTNSPDNEQQTWFKIFRENGADIILGDHPHAVQPVSLNDYNGKKIFEAYCPGNFANVYRKQQGDTSALIEVYIDKTSKSVIGGGVIPLYTQAGMNTNYRAIPIFEIENNFKIRSELSTDDYERSREAHKTVTSVMLGHEMDMSMLTPSYLFNESGFLRRKNDGITLTEKQKNGVLWKALSKAGSVCFVGDSLTEGTKNGGVPWYEPIEPSLEGKTVSNFSKGGCTVSYISENVNGIPASELYVVAIGTNDVRYRDYSYCAMTADGYIGEIKRIKDALKTKSPKAEFVWIAPWYSTDGDPYTNLSYADKLKLNGEYSDALKEFAKSEGDGYINVNAELKHCFDTFPQSEYLLDHIHPNAHKGVMLYSRLVLDK